MKLEKLIFKISLGILLLVLSTGNLMAQDYKTAVGLRGGAGLGITVKHFINEKAALEGIVNSRWDGFNITGLYEVHVNAFNTTGLNWYYGGGAHIGFWDGNNVPWINDVDSYTIIGIDFIGGLEYRMEDFPLVVSVDWKPAINFSGYTGFWGDNGAFSVRYCF